PPPPPRPPTPRGADGKTYHVPSDMTYEEWKKEYVGKSIEKSHESDTIKTKEISGALNPGSERAEAHAERYYESVRKMKTDVKRIAENTGYPEKEIRRIKDFIFMTKHDLGRGKLEYFDPSYEMAQSWQRLIDGRNIQEHDLTLLKHEMLEHELMSKGLAQNEAHDIVSRIYNYKEESDRYYAKINKHKKDR
ncbi:MAG: phage head morphogenesis protein, partial [Acetatifactor sp.]|nr:phage head morphogenesis protein [Acetatifactor sp.]